MSTQKRLPKAVSQWLRILLAEGEPPIAAMRHAIDRAFQAGDISEATADRLEDIKT